MEWVCIPSAGELDRLSIWRLWLLCTLALGQTCNSVFPSFYSVYFIHDIGCISLVSTGLCLLFWNFSDFKKSKCLTRASFLSWTIIYSRLKMAIYCPQGSGTLRQQLSSMHDIAWYCMVLQCIAWYCMVLHGIAWYCMVLHGIAWY